MELQLERINNTALIDRLMKLIALIWPSHYTPIIGKDQVEYMMATYQSREEIERQIAGNTVYLLLTAGSSDAGYMAYETRPDGLYLSKLYVLGSFRGKGLGKFMEQTACDAAKKSGCKRIYLNVNRHNTSSVNVYKALGYSVEREMIKDLGLGFVMDDFVMGKSL